MNLSLIKLKKQVIGIQSNSFLTNNKQLKNFHKNKKMFVNNYNKGQNQLASKQGKDKKFFQ